MITLFFVAKVKPECQYGAILKKIFKNENFVNRVIFRIASKIFIVSLLI